MASLKSLSTTSSGCENGCKNTTYWFQSARTEADHQKVNTILNQFRNTVLMEPTLQIWLQAPLGDHSRGQELVAKGHCTETVSLDSHACPNLHRIFQTCCICPLATKMVSSWFHTVALKASRGFAQQPSCRFRLSSYKQHSSRGKGGFQGTLMPALIP